MELNSTGLVSSCHRALITLEFFLVGVSWVRHFYSRVFRSPNFLLQGFLFVLVFILWVFRPPKVFLVDIWWVQILFLRVFRGFEILSRGFFGPKSFSCWYFLFPKFFLEDMLWITREYSEVTNKNNKMLQSSRSYFGKSYT